MIYSNSSSKTTSRASKRRLLKPRMYVMINCQNYSDICYLDSPSHRYELMVNCGFLIGSDKFFQLRAVKLFLDGALGSWGASLLDPYEG
jgi:hypothetical protein